MTCLLQYEIKNRNKYMIEYDYSITFENKQADEKLFYVNKSIDCLSFKFSSQTYSDTVLEGLHKLNVNIMDKSNLMDSIVCKIYITSTCEQKSFILIGHNIDFVELNMRNFTRFIFKKNFKLIEILSKIIILITKKKPSKSFMSELASSLYLRKIDSIMHEIYTIPLENNSEEQFKNSK